MGDKFSKRGCCGGCIILTVAIGAIVGLAVVIARKVMPTMMPRMMVEMMPRRLRMLLPNMPQEERIDFALRLVTILMEQGTAGMSEDEKGAFVAKVVEKVQG